MFMKCKVTVNTSHYPKDVPWELPEGWCWCKLEELCAFLSRGKSPVYSETSKEYPVFAQKCNLKEGGISLEKALFLNPDSLPKWPTEYRLKTGDVLVNSTGTGTVGRTRLFNEQVLGPYPFVVPDSHVSVIRTFSQISSEYVFILLSSEYGQQYFAENLAGSTNQKELYIASIAELQVPLPPAMEQKRIAEQVFSFEDNIKNLDDEKIRIQSFVESAKAKILDLAIHGKIVPQDPSDEPAIELLKRINPGFRPSDNLHYGDCPEGWTIATVADVFEINPKVQGFDEVDAGFVPMTNICDGFRNKFNFEVRKWAKIKNGFTRFANGDIAVAKISPCLENRKSAIMRNLPNGIGAGTTELNIFRSRAVNPEYGLLFFKSDDFINACAGSYNGVVGQQRVSRSLIEGMQFLLPPMEEQKRIVAAINGYFAVINDIESSLQ